MKIQFVNQKIDDMNEIVITTLAVIGVYLLGMGISYIVAAKVIGFDNMISDDKDTANWIISFSWPGIIFVIIVAIIYGLKLLLDFCLNIKSE